jgi:hypothetical protein
VDRLEKVTASSGVSRAEVDDDVSADVWVPLVSEERKRKGYRFGMLGRGPTLAVG